MSIKLLIIASALALAATALPDVDTSTPEFELAEAQEIEASFTEAESLMQEQGSNACNDLAKTTENEVNNNINREQNMLNKLDRGGSCPSKGDDVVKKAKQEQTNAQNAYNTAKNNLSKAQGQSVNFGATRFASITKGNCNMFFNSGNYRNAENNVKHHNNIVNQKKGALDAAKKAVDQAHKTKAGLVAQCQCDVATNMDKMYAAASGRAKNSNQAAWTKAAHLRCVIKGTPANKCKVPNMRTLSKPGLQGGASKSKCSAGSGGYAFTALTKVTCPAGKSPIFNEATCKTAMKSLTGKSVSSVGRSCWRKHPVGCFTHYPKNKSTRILMNNNGCGLKSGTTYYDTSAICKRL